MRCPECKQDALEPEYSEFLNGLLNDDPHDHSIRPAVVQVLTVLFCRSCRAYYFVSPGETAAQAYQRILHDCAND